MMGREEQGAAFTGKIIDDDAQELIGNDRVKAGRWFVEFNKFGSLLKGQEQAELGLVPAGDLTKLLFHGYFERIGVLAG